jgi:hypothetical protein
MWRWSFNWRKREWRRGKFDTSATAARIECDTQSDECDYLRRTNGYIYRNREWHN